MEFKALIVSENHNGIFRRTIEKRTVHELPLGELCIQVLYSSLNYKDALSATGNKGITRHYPHTPGIDAAGIVTESASSGFSKGDQVIVTGYDLGMNTPGGFGQYIRVPAKWAIHKPEAFSLLDCMTIGTAGLTAAIALHKMELLGMIPQRGPIVVTGASGGVGSFSTALLAKKGFDVTAVTGKKEAKSFLLDLGAQKVESREFTNDHSGKPLLKSRWAGAIDTVGGNTLATLLKGCSNEGVIVCTGMVESPHLQTTVFPFILNGISLVGVGSAETPVELKQILWNKLAATNKITEVLEKLRTIVSLDELNERFIPLILEGKITGRIVIDLQK